MRLLILPFLFISLASTAQCKSYKLSRNGDTLNCIDMNNLKQGKWVTTKPGLRGEPGYDEEGIYKDDKKEGTWRLYTSMGDVFAIERYRWGNKDGINEYYNIAGLIRRESWKAVNPANPYDTVEVIDPVDPYKVQMKVVKIEGTSVKHGVWKYYESGTGALVKTENWFLDKLQDPMAATTSADGSSKTDSSKTAKPVVKTKPKEVEAFEKKIGKKKVKVIDGRTKY